VRLQRIEPQISAAVERLDLHRPRAIRIGLIPPLPRDGVTYVGNAAGLGAQMALVSEAAMQFR
jgi:uncharacterized 2Fe-2S/4Fe-4S cluster protein (DUF4445 family)